MFTAYQTSNFMSGKLIVIILVVASVFAWSVMVTKYLDLVRAKRASRRFQLAFRNEAHPLALLSQAPRASRKAPSTRSTRPDAWPSAGN